MTRPKRLTLQEIAKRAGVSAPTVSKVLNGRSDVSAETRERVLQALREEEYLPRGASAVPRSRTQVELVLDDFESPNNLEMLRGILRGAAANGAHVGISTLPENVNARHWVNELERAGCSGVIMVTSRLSREQQRRLDDANLSVVLIDPLSPLPATLTSVGATNWQGGMSAVAHLLDLGHMRIGMLRGTDCLVDDARYHGYVAALSSRGIEVDPSIVSRAFFRFEPAIPAALDLLRLPDRPTAIFAASDYEALGVLEAARQLGLHVPADLSVVGFDDNIGARTASPSLTTVRQPFLQMGETAYRVLVDQINGVSSPGRVELATTLITRGSTAPPKKKNAC
jgi:LacI family transcriptional regulator